MEYPEELTSQIKQQDRIINFVPFGTDNWIALTAERLIFHAKSKKIGEEQKKSPATAGWQSGSTSAVVQLRIGNLPISKMTSIQRVEGKACFGISEQIYLEVTMQDAVHWIFVGKDVDLEPIITEFNVRRI